MRFFLIVAIFGCFVYAQDLSKIVENYADIVLISYEESLDTAKQLQESVQNFVKSPSPKSLQLAKEAWLRARIPYNQTEGYRFYNGPIDDEDGPEGLLNSWPLDEAYIDYVRGNDKAGIINDPKVELSKQKLVSMNEVGGDENISTGYHAIEFLLWGQDLSVDGPGNRSHKDYINATNADRRAQYLLVATELLVENLESLVADWQKDKDNYRKKFLSMEPKAALLKILTGIHELSTGELPGERMAVALNNHDQEDEHSCFSDNTCLDIYYNAKSIQNIYYGRYTRMNGQVMQGPGIKEWLQVVNSELAKQIDTQTGVVNSALEPMLKVAFDRLIAADNPQGNTLVKNAMIALSKQGEFLEKTLEILQGHEN